MDDGGPDQVMVGAELANVSEMRLEELVGADDSVLTNSLRAVVERVARAPESYTAFGSAVS